MTRSFSEAVQPSPGLAHRSVGSIDDVGTRKGCATSASNASTNNAATASVTSHSTIVRHTGGRKPRCLVAQLVAQPVAARTDAGADDTLL